MSNGVEFFCLVCGADFKLMVGGHMSPARPGYCSTKCRYDSYAQEKRDAYENDDYKFPPPPVCTASWNDVDWIAYIDKEGEWGFEQVQEEEDCRFDTTAERDDFYEEIERDA
jgi:hypothetical protein